MINALEIIAIFTMLINASDFMICLYILTFTESAYDCGGMNV